MRAIELQDFTYQERINALRATKMKHTAEKWQQLGSMDYDDHGMVLPPPDSRKVVEVISGSGIPITDVLLKEFAVKSNHPSGGFFGPKACGENFRRLLEVHPTYIDPSGIRISITRICRRNSKNINYSTASAPSSIFARI